MCCVVAEKRSGDKSGDWGQKGTGISQLYFLIGFLKVIFCTECWFFLSPLSPVPTLLSFFATTILLLLYIIGKE